MKRVISSLRPLLATQLLWFARSPSWAPHLALPVALLLMSGQLACQRPPEMPGPSGPAGGADAETRSAGDEAQGVAHKIAKPRASSDAYTEQAEALPHAIITLQTGSANPPLTLEVELALDDKARQRGLMFRHVLEAGHGMLFFFDRMRVNRFWMKNTLIPLDMLFIDNKGRVVGIVHQAAPLSEAPRSVGSASQMVLELPGGYAAAQGIAAGTRLHFQRLPAGISPPRGFAP